MTQDELAVFFAGLDAWTAGRAVPVETLAYGDHEDQELDLREPSTSGPHPLALVLHGGFWRAPFTRRNTAALAVALTEAGWATANVEYRRLGPGAYRPMLADVAAAAGRLTGYDTVVSVGHSAGGHLALWLAAEGVVDAAVALAGICDLAAASRARLGDAAVDELLGGSPADRPDAYREVNPGARLPLGRRQVLIHGLRDDRVPIDHARRYAERARAAGDDCRLVEVDGDHFAPIDPGSEAWSTIREVLDPECYATARRGGA